MPDSNVRLCPKCQGIVLVTDIFCYTCGHRLITEEQPSPQIDLHPSAEITQQLEIQDFSALEPAAPSAAAAPSEAVEPAVGAGAARPESIGSAGAAAVRPEATGGAGARPLGSGNIAPRPLDSSNIITIDDDEAIAEEPTGDQVGSEAGPGPSSTEPGSWAAATAVEPRASRSSPSDAQISSGASVSSRMPASAGAPAPSGASLSSDTPASSGTPSSAKMPASSGAPVSSGARAAKGAHRIKVALAAALGLVVLVIGFLVIQRLRTTKVTLPSLAELKATVLPSSATTPTARPRAGETSTSEVRPKAGETSVTEVRPKEGATGATEIHPKVAETTSSTVHPNAGETSVSTVRPSAGETSATGVQPKAAETSAMSLPQIKPAQTSEEARVAAEKGASEPAAASEAQAQSPAIDLTPAAAPAITPTLTADGLLIKQMLADADKCTAAKKYVEPLHDNALELYQKVREKEPSNAQAQDGLYKLREFFLKQATASCKNGKFDDANHSFDTAAQIMKGKVEDPKVRKAREECEKLKQQAVATDRLKLLLESAQKSYESHNYQTALEYLKQILSTDGNHKEATRLQQQIIEQVKALSRQEEVVPFLGITAHNVFTKKEADTELPAGFRVVKVLPGGPAHNVLLFNDVVTDVNGHPATSIELLSAHFKEEPPAAAAAVKYSRNETLQSGQLKLEGKPLATEMEAYIRDYNNHLQSLKNEDLFKVSLRWFEQQKDSSCVQELVNFYAGTTGKPQKKETLRVLGTFPISLVGNGFTAVLERTEATSETFKNVIDALSRLETPENAKDIATYLRQFIKRNPGSDAKLLAIIDFINEAKLKPMTLDLVNLLKDEQQPVSVRAAAAKVLVKIGGDAGKNSVEEVYKGLQEGDLKTRLRVVLK